MPDAWCFDDGLRSLCRAQPARRRRRCRGSVTAMAVIGLALLAIAAAVYLVNTRSGQDTTAQDERATRSLGLGDPVENRLASGFTDADGDGVADPPTATRDPQVLRLSYLTTAAGIDAAALEPLRTHLAAATGREVVFVAVEDKKAQLRALAAGELDVTGFNTGAVPVAVNVAGFIPVARPARSGTVEGTSEGAGASYTMVIITPKGSGIAKPADLRGRSLTFTRWGSNSGHKAPLVLLRDEFGLVPPRDYSWSFSYGHANSIAGIADGTLEAAAVASDLLAAAEQAGQIAPEDYRVIYESASFPVAALGYAHDLEAGLAERVRTALLSFVPAGTPASKAMAGAVSMAPVDYKDDFALVRMIDNTMGFVHELPANPEEPTTSGE